MQKFPFEEIDDLYRKVILDHNRKARDVPQVVDPDIEYDEYNPICGDRVVLQLKLDGANIGQAGFQGEGCSITQASASMMVELLSGKTLEEAEELSETVRAMMRGQTSQQELGSLGSLEALQAVRKFPVRIKCALLAWTALEIGIEEYRARRSR